MFTRTLLAIGLAALLSGCNSLIATATGPEPIGQNAPGARTFSMRVEDSSIERTAEVNIFKSDPAFRQANVNVLSFYGSVLMAGQVPSEELKAKAEQIVRQIAEVKQVHNELTVGPASYYQERSTDGLITTRIRSALLLDANFPSSRTRVFTVGGTVYLMGKLTQTEARQALDVVKQVPGVKKIVTLIDYLPAASGAPAPAANGS